MTLLAWGANGYGQLGLGRCSECELNPVEVQISPSISIRSIACSANHSIIIDGNGDLLSTGRNNRGQLGIGTTCDQNTFTRIILNEKFKQVAAGWDFSAAISTDQSLFVWGSNKYGQLGFDKKRNQFICNVTLLQLPFKEKPMEVQFGLRFMSLLTNLKNIYVVGQISHLIGPNDSSPQFTKVAENVKTFSTGQKHLIYLTEDDQTTVKALGDNKYQQSIDFAFEKNIKLLRSGWSFNAALTVSNELYLWGRNSYGQLGNGLRENSNREPQKSPITTVDKVQLGAEHCIFTSHNDVFTNGWNEHGSCGNGDTEDV